MMPASQPDFEYKGHTIRDSTKDREKVQPNSSPRKWWPNKRQQCTTLEKICSFGQVSAMLLACTPNVMSSALLMNQYRLTEYLGN